MRRYFQPATLLTLLAPAVFISALLPDRAAAQFREAVSAPAVEVTRSSSVPLSTFALTNESVAAQPNTALFPTTSTAGKKSGTLAAILSLAIPGLGEYYVGDQIWRGAIFTGLEAGLWYGNLHWTARGDDSTAAFWAFGDQHWSLDRYAKYLNTMLATDSTAPRANAADPPSINRAEEWLANSNHPNFTHRLPFNDRQQYNELISKYIQYTPGWDDATDPSNPVSSTHYQEAADMRERMNDQYAVASYFLWGVIANHVLSAIDAALLARDHNSSIHLEGELVPRMNPDGTTGYVPTACISYRF